jgi:protein-S-isoprenylcysteine O-methyltransferase Ste14
MKKIVRKPEEYKGKSGLIGRFSVSLGFLFLFIFVFLKIVSFLAGGSTGFLKSLYDISISTVPDSFVALGAILVFFGLIFFYFSHQFSKLEKIADEIEKSEEFKE